MLTHTELQQQELWNLKFLGQQCLSSHWTMQYIPDMSLLRLHILQLLSYRVTWLNTIGLTTCFIFWKIHHRVTTVCRISGVIGRDKDSILKAALHIESVTCTGKDAWIIATNENLHITISGRQRLLDGAQTVILRATGRDASITQDLWCLDQLGLQQKIWAYVQYMCPIFWKSCTTRGK